MRQVRPDWSLLFVCLLCCALVGGVGVGLVAADGEYDLTVDDAIQTPSQTVSYEGNSYEFDGFAVIDPGESIHIDVTAPSEAGFDVHLVKSETDVEDFGPSGEGSETVTFDTGDDIEPGTYSLVLFSEGDPQAVHPVIVSGYEITGLGDEEAATDETIEYEISVTPTHLTDDPAGVEVVIWNDDHVERTDASGSDGSYSATVDASAFDPGEYNVHVAALGEDEFRGEPEILGMSEQRTLEITDSSDGDGTENGGAGGGGVPDPGEEDPDENDRTDENDSEADNETDVTPSESTETVEIADETPDSPGVRVTFENTTARSVTFSNETASGTVTVTEHDEPPSGANHLTGTPIATVEITVPEAERNAAATLEFAIDAEAVTDSDRLAVQRYDAENETWSRLETTVADENENEITVTAETPGFSIFTVTETDEESNSGANGNETDGTNTSDNGSDRSDDSIITPTDPGGESETETPEPEPEEQAGFGIVPAVLAVVAVGWIASRRRGRDT